MSIQVEYMLNYIRTLVHMYRVTGNLSYKYEAHKCISLCRELIRQDQLDETILLKVA